LKFRIGRVFTDQYKTGTPDSIKQQDFAGLTGNEVVYDLYTRTGTANFIAESARTVGMNIEEAVRDAVMNSDINNIKNTGSLQVILISAE
jgi:hypothetical protein